MKSLTIKAEGFDLQMRVGDRFTFDGFQIIFRPSPENSEEIREKTNSYSAEVTRKEWARINMLATFYTSKPQNRGAFSANIENYQVRAINFTELKR